MLRGWYYGGGGGGSDAVAIGSSDDVPFWHRYFRTELRPNLGPLIATVLPMPFIIFDPGEKNAIKGNAISILTGLYCKVVDPKCVEAKSEK